MEYVCRTGNYHQIIAIIDDDNINKIFGLVCRYGRLNIAKKLLSTCGTKINVYVKDEWTFQCSCQCGHLMVAQWLYAIVPDINVHIGDEYTFRWTCQNGYLAVTQWLYVNAPDINVHAKNEDAFRYSCQNGHLAVAQWLYHIAPDIDIHAQNHDAFRWSCINNYQDETRFLATINDSDSIKYYMTDNHGYIFSTDNKKLWSAIYKLDYGYLHYFSPAHLDDILQHHRMIVAQTRCKSAKKLII